MGSEIFKFGPRKAEIIGIQDLSCTSKLWAEPTFIEKMLKVKNLVMKTKINKDGLKLTTVYFEKSNIPMTSDFKMVSLIQGIGWNQ